MYEVEERQLEAHPTLVRRSVLAVEELPEWLGQTYKLTFHRAEETGATPVGMPFARYQVLDDGRFSVEAGVAIDREVDPGSQVEVGTLPGGRAVAVWHLGPYEKIGAAYAKLNDWVQRHGVVPTGVPWEAYYDDDIDPEAHRSEVVQPYMR